MTAEETREYHRLYQRNWRKRQKGVLPRKPTLVSTEGVGEVGCAGPPEARPDRETLLERRARLNAPHRSQVGMLMGDPPVGYSALDRD